MSLVIPPADAVGIMLPILCTMDVIGLRRFAGSFDWPNLRIILPGALVGIALGSLCFGLLNKGWLLLLVGAIGVVMFFLVVNYVKLVPYYFLGQLHLRNLLAALVLLPLAPVGVYIGLWMQGRITDETVYRWANILRFSTGWKLIWDGASMLRRIGLI